jgi:SAM-dependent methyltransferase
MDPRNRLVYARHDAALAGAARRYARGRLIDIGCCDKPYGAMFAPYVEDHVGVDHAATRHDHATPDVVAGAYDIPLADASFDTALCTSVLEHLEEPAEALAECHRLLRPGGHAIYSVPFIWHVHEAPRDFYRFSPFGLRHRFEKAGFEVVRLEALSGFWVTFGTLLSYKLFAWKKGRPWLHRLGVIDTATWVVQRAAAGLDRIDRDERWTWMYLVVAKKPGSDG